MKQEILDLAEKMHSQMLRNMELGGRCLEELVAKGKEEHLKTFGKVYVWDDSLKLNASGKSNKSPSEKEERETFMRLSFQDRIIAIIKEKNALTASELYEEMLKMDGRANENTVRSTVYKMHGLEKPLILSRKKFSFNHNYVKATSKEK